MARILLIDDDPDVRTILRLTLTAFGHTVIEACDGREGLEKFAGSDAELVITDIVMPEMEGTEVIRELRKTHPQLKIIAMSGGGRSGPAEYLRMAGALGAVKGLTKPFSNEELITAINELLSGPPDALPAPG